MRIFMQSPAGPAEAPRYCQLLLQQDLFGGWVLLRESGQAGNRTTLKREQFLNLKEAQAAFERARDQQLKKGFRVTIVQGDDVHGTTPRH
jgi:predicted DNA-binding WGR domain protein